VNSVKNLARYFAKRQFLSSPEPSPGSGLSMQIPMIVSD